MSGLMMDHDFSEFIPFHYKYKYLDYDSLFLAPLPLTLMYSETTPLLSSTNTTSNLRQRVESAGSYSLGKQKAENDGLDNFASDSESAASHPSTLLTTTVDPKATPPSSTGDCLWSFFGLLDNASLRLENSGSVARDHLASERTFLAYMRTSLAIASSGVALVQLFATSSISSDATSRLAHFIRPLGVVRYFAVQQALLKGQFPAARIATGFIAFTISVLVTITFGIMLTGRLQPSGSKPH
ncbi:hypothetical protein CVT24_004526 [Panaeolus cyanescens]|uniref:DUF202 domain-containing protein n=1 Tax=Panaeolus cyanescens TaxID=181874 RepID=A0A409YBU0_9AGAR|nr:hypothetical protein CVT24_004526 [Panaeolus cyanescens]